MVVSPGTKSLRPSLLPQEHGINRTERGISTSFTHVSFLLKG